MMKTTIKDLISYIPLMLFVLIWVVRGFTGHYIPMAYNSDMMEYVPGVSVVNNMLYALVFIVFVCYSFNAKFMSKGVICILFVSLLIGILYFTESMIVHNEHFFPLSRAALNPLYLLIFPTAFVAYKRNRFECLLKIVLLVSILFLALGVYVFITDVSGVFVRGHTPLLQFRTGAFWGFIFYLSFKQELSKRDYIILLIGLIFCTFISFVIASRSWCIQGAVSLVVLHTIAFKTKKTRSLSILTLCFVLLYIIPYLFKVFTDAIWYDVFVDKLDQDTRSIQYIEVFKQMPLSYFIFGNGFHTSWISEGVEYRYIDNQTIMFLYRYGLIPTLAYYIILLTPAIKVLINHKRLNYKNIIFVLMWVMAINGLAVFNTLNWDWSNYLMALAAARLWDVIKIA